MKKITVLLSIVLSFHVVFAGNVFCETQKVSDQQITACLTAMFMRNTRTAYSLQSIEKLYEEENMKNDELFAQWDSKADKKPINQYRRGVYYFLKALETEEEEYFDDALPFLEAAEGKVDPDDRVNVFLSLDRMLEACNLSKGDRKHFLLEIKTTPAGAVNYFMYPVN